MGYRSANIVSVKKVETLKSVSTSSPIPAIIQNTHFLSRINSAVNML